MTFGSTIRLSTLLLVVVAWGLRSRGLAGASPGEPTQDVCTAPAITSVQPTAAQIGTRISITGYCFGNQPDDGFVTVADRTLPVASWSDRSVEVDISPGTQSGDLIIATPKGVSIGVPFRVYNYVTPGPDQRVVAGVIIVKLRPSVDPTMLIALGARRQPSR